MATMLKMECECGYSVGVTLGGTRSNFETVCNFPHYCEDCGVVTANTYVDPVHCPTCGRGDIIRYGQVQASRPPDVDVMEWIRKSHYEWNERATKPRSDKAVSAGKFKLSETSHLCPKCKKMTLRADIGSRLLID